MILSSLAERYHGLAGAYPCRLRLGFRNRSAAFTAFGVEAGEAMAAVQVAMAAGLPYTALRDMVLTHPTMAEGLVVLFSAVPARR